MTVVLAFRCHIGQIPESFTAGWLTAVVVTYGGDVLQRAVGPVARRARVMHASLVAAFLWLCRQQKAGLFSAVGPAVGKGMTVDSRAG